MVRGYKDFKIELPPVSVKEIREQLVWNGHFETGDLEGWTYDPDEGKVEVKKYVDLGFTKPPDQVYLAKVTPKPNTFLYLKQSPGFYFYVMPRDIITITAGMKADANITHSHILCGQVKADGTVTRYSSANYGGDYDWTAKEETFDVKPGVVKCYVAIDFKSGAVEGNGYVDYITVFSRVREFRENEYDCLTLDLGIARTAERIGVHAQSLTIMKCTGTVEFTFEKETNDPIIIEPIVYPAMITFVRNFKDIFITNDAQPGKSVTFYFGILV